MKNITKIIIALLLINYGAFSQKNKFIELADTSLIEHSTPEGWIYFKQKAFEPEQLFAKNKKSFGIEEGFSMKIIKNTKGENGFEHFKYKQYFDNIIIENSIFTIPIWTPIG